MNGNDTQFETITLYACWASGLINGDWSSFDDDELIEIQEQLDEIGLSATDFVDVDIDNCWFGYPDTSGLLGDVCEYTYVELEQETNYE